MASWRRVLLCSLAAACPVVSGFTSMPGSCSTPGSGHGSSAQLTGAAATGALSFTNAAGAAVTSGCPGESITVTLSDTQTFKGFLVTATGAASGSLEACGDGGALSTCASAVKTNCGSGKVGVGHRSSYCSGGICRFTSPVSFLLTLPPSGTVSVSAVLVHGAFKKWNSVPDASISVDVDCDCAGSWSACTSACEAAGGRTWTGTQEQSGNGAACPTATDCGHGDGACVNVDCAGEWSDCTSACEAAGSRTWAQSVAPDGIGTACPAATDCAHGEDACVITNCAGDWSACTSACEAASARSWEQTAAPAGTGSACPTTAPDCLNGDGACVIAGAVDCVGSWGAFGACDGTDRTRSFAVTTPSENGGAACEAANGAEESQSCSHCSGSWGPWGACSSTSCGAGQRSRAFSVASDAVNGGSACEAADGQEESEACDGTACANGGSCAASGEACECEGNFIGNFCETECGCSGHGSQTAIGDARGSGTCSAGSCDCEEPFTGNLCGSIASSLTVDATLAEVGAAGSQARQTFEDNVKASVAAEFVAGGLTAVTAANVSIVSITAGSVVVDYSVAIPSSVSVQDSSAALARLVERAERGQLTVGSYSTAAVAAVAGQSLVLDTMLSMSWTLASELNDDGAREATIELTYDGLGWVSFGVPQTPGEMIGAEAIIGLPGQPVRWYTMSSKMVSGVVASGTPAVGASVTQAARSTTLGFVWPLPESGAAEIIWAYGSGNVLAYHAEKGAANVDFVSGAAALSTSSRKLNLALLHGLLMLAAWALLLPAGIMMSVLRDSPGCIAERGWINLHRNLQCAGVAVAIAGLAVAWWMVDGHHFHGHSSSLAMPHAVLGAIVMLFAVQQPINGLLRPHATALGATKTAGRRRWERLHKTGGRLAMVVSLATTHPMLLNLRRVFWQCWARKA